MRMFMIICTLGNFQTYNILLSSPSCTFHLHVFSFDIVKFIQLFLYIFAFCVFFKKSLSASNLE